MRLNSALGRTPSSTAPAALAPQAIGLARLGHRVHATDLSPAAVARAEQEAGAAGVSLSLGVADMRTLSEQVPGTFDVVLACDKRPPY